MEECKATRTSMNHKEKLRNKDGTYKVDESLQHRSFCDWDSSEAH